MLKPLQLATIFYAAKTENREALLKLLEPTDVDDESGRELFRRLPGMGTRGLMYIFRGFFNKGAGVSISADALALVAERINNPDIGAAIFSTMFASADVSTEKLSNSCCVQFLPTVSLSDERID